MRKALSWVFVVAVIAAGFFWAKHLDRQRATKSLLMTNDYAEYLTNVSLTASAILTNDYGPSIEWQHGLTIGPRELGYRSDGVVVWREVPKGK